MIFDARNRTATHPHRLCWRVRACVRMYIVYATRWPWLWPYDSLLPPRLFILSRPSVVSESRAQRSVFITRDVVGARGPERIRGGDDGGANERERDVAAGGNG